MAAVVPKGGREQQSCNQTLIHIKHEWEVDFEGWNAWIYLDATGHLNVPMWSACPMQDVYLNLLIDMRTVDPQWEQESVNMRPLLLQELPALFWVCVRTASVPGKMPAPKTVLHSGKRPHSPGCGSSETSQSPVSMQDTAGSALVPPWGLDTIWTSFRCRRNKSQHVQSEK